MKNQYEIEEIIRKGVKENWTIPEEVDKTIQQTYKKLGKQEKDKGRKIFAKYIHIAAVVLMVLFLGSNVMAYIQGKDNIFSFILGKFHIQEEYEKESKEINLVKESNGTKITIKDIAVDNSFFVIGYQIETKKELENNLFLIEDIKIKDNEKQITITNASLGDKETKQSVQKIGENTYIIYEIYFIENICHTQKNFQVDIKISQIQIYEKESGNYFMKDKIEGNWDFSICLDESKNTSKAEEYILENVKILLKDNQELEIVNIQLSNIATLITTYTEEQEYQFLTLEIRDKAGNILLTKDTQKIENGISKVFTRKIDEQEELRILVYEKDSENLLGEGELTLKNQGKPSQTKDSYQTIQLKDIKLLIPENNEIVFTTEEKRIYQLYRYYNQKRCEADTYLKISAKAYNNTLEELKEEIKLGREISTTIHEENYLEYNEQKGYYTLIDEKDYPNLTTKKTMLTKEEIYGLIEGKMQNIVKGNQIITKNDIKDFWREDLKVVSEEKIEINNVKVYKMNIATYVDSEVIYAFIKDNLAYEISYSLRSYYGQQLEQAIYNMKVD